nr:shaggy-related protein kinase kappa isoform X2 [Aegilops tauschii subsp. strangulata]
MAYSGQRHAGAAGSSSRQGNGLKGQASSVEFLGRGMVGMQLRDAKPDDADDERDNEPDVVADSGSEAGQIIATTIRGRNGLPKQCVSYIAEHVVGTGSFGVVFQAKCRETGEVVAIKKVLQDKRYKNRELQIMHMLDHPNIVGLKHYFFSTTERNELYLNLVLEFVPETVNRMARQYNRMNQRVPLIYVKLYTYQIKNYFEFCHTSVSFLLLFRYAEHLLIYTTVLASATVISNHRMFSLTHIHTSSKYVILAVQKCWSRESQISPTYAQDTTEHQNSYLVQLNIQLPLICGPQAVSWQSCFLDSLFFLGKVELISWLRLSSALQVLGTPTREEIKCMNPNYTEFKFPQIKAHPWHKVFQKKLPPEAMDLVSRFLQYSPDLRCTAMEACMHPFFDELRDPNTRLPNGRPLPPLFNFRSQELNGIPPEVVERLVPEHARKQNLFMALRT